MNQYDSNRIYDIMKKINYVKTSNSSEADCYVLNTCHIREKATEKVYHDVGRIKKNFKNKKKPIVVIAGCVAQAEGEILLQREKYVDAVIGPQSYSKLNEIVLKLENKSDEIISTDFNVIEKFDTLNSIKNLDNNISSFLTIQEGCNKFCTYCIVPYVKGRELYRPAQEIVDEVRLLVEKHGIREVTLLGQTVTSYNLKNRKSGEPRFAELLLRVAEIAGLHRVRFMTGYPKDVHDDLLEAFRIQHKIQPYIHMPVQSGSDRILRMMNRGYRRDTYLEKMAALRTARPGLSLTSDLIVGFPGETEDDFLQTISLMEEVRYDSVFSFAYSERPGTRAASFADSVPQSERRKRLVHLNAVQDRITRALLRECVGLTQEVLVLGPSARDPKMLRGRTPEHRMINFAGDAHIGDLVRVNILEAGHHTLRGAQVITNVA